MLLQPRELVLIFGPCGAGKTTYAQAYYPHHIRPEIEAIICALTPDGTLHFYPTLRALARQMQRLAVEEALRRDYAVCLAGAGATRQERARWVALAQAYVAPVHGVRLLVDAETCIARALADRRRPSTSRPKWLPIVQRYQRRWEPVDADHEGFASYKELPW